MTRARSRRTLLALLASPLLLLPASTAGVLPADVEGQAATLRLDLSEHAEAYDLALASHAPVPAAATGIGPGSHLLIRMQGGLYGCTANFVWVSDGVYYLGAAGHCFLPENRKATHGEGADYDPAGTRVSVCVDACFFGGELGFVRQGALAALGPVAYARQTGRTGDLGNDFGVVQIPASLHHLIRPSMPVFDGPVRSGGMTWQSTVCHFGNGVGVGETFLTHGRVGVGLGEGSRGSWTAVLASAPGDSGSAVQTCVVDENGVHGDAAAGILTHISGGFIVGTTMTKAVEMAREADLELALVTAA